MPPWQCPICRVGHTQIVADSFKYEENAESRAAHSHDAWDPEWNTYVFAAWGECSNRKCKQCFALSGNGSLEEYYDEETGEPGYVHKFNPLFCHPMPHIIALPGNCPEEVQGQLESAFQLFWVNRTACANRIRAAIEALLDHVRVPRKRKSSANRFHELSLHERLNWLSQKDADISGQLMAMKWLGNAGSHSGTPRDVTSDDLLNAFELFEHVLSELIGKRSARVKQLAKTLQRRHAR